MKCNAVFGILHSYQCIFSATTKLHGTFCIVSGEDHKFGVRTLSTTVAKCSTMSLVHFDAQTP